MPQLVPGALGCSRVAQRHQVGEGRAVHGSQLLSSCSAVSARAVRGEQHGFPSVAAAWKREQWPWQNHSIPGWLTELLAQTLERGEGTLGGAGGGRRGGKSQHMCTAEATKTADPGRAGGTHRGERNGREAKGTAQNLKKRQEESVAYGEGK